MGKLEKAKIIKNIMGKNGGYLLIQNIDKINLYDISEILEAKIIKTTWFTGDEKATCMISANIKRYFEGLSTNANMFLIPFLKGVYLIDIENNLFFKKEV